MKSDIEKNDADTEKVRNAFSRVVKSVFGTVRSTVSKIGGLLRKSTVISIACAIFTITCAAAIILFASHVFGKINANISEVKLETNLEFDLVYSSESLIFKEGGEKKELAISMANTSGSHLEYDIGIKYEASSDLASAILVYYDGEFCGTLGQLCSKGDGAIGEALLGVGFVGDGVTDKSHTVTLELHEAAPKSYYDKKSLDFTVLAYTKTVDYSEYMVVTDENGFRRAVDDINTGLVEARKIVLCNNVALTDSYSLNYPTEINLNGFTLDLAGNTVSLNGDGVYVIDSTAPILSDASISGSIELNSDGALLDVREFKNADGDNFSVNYGKIITLKSYDRTAANALLIERLESLHCDGVLSGKTVYLFGSLMRYAESPSFEIGDYSEADGTLTIPTVKTTEIVSVAFSGTTFDLKVIGKDDSAFEAIIAKELAHIPTDGETKITSDIFLPKSLKAKNATVTWTSGDDKTISADGKISNVVNDNQQVSLFAEIRINDKVYTKEFSFRVSSQNNETKFSYLVAQLSPITLTSVYDPENNNGNSAFHHLPIVDPAFPRETGEKSGYDYRETFATPINTQSYVWIEYKDIGLERLEYRVTNTYNYISVESGVDGEGRPISYAYLNIPVFYTYAQIEITGYYSETEYYTDIVNVIIQLGDNSDLQNKVFRYVENILNNTDILQNILDTRAADGMARERGDFELPNEYITYDIVYKAADSSKDAITDVTTLYRGEGDERTVSGYLISVDPAHFYTTETPLGITVTIKHKTATDASPATRILYFDAPPVIKPDEGGFANLSVFNSVKYQIYTQLPEDERDGESGFVLSDGKLINNTGAYILMRDAQHENVKTLTFTTLPSIDTVNEKVYVLSRLLEWATSASIYSAKDVWSSATAVNSDGKDYLTDAEIGVIKSYWRFVTGSEMTDEMIKSAFETAVGRVIIDGQRIVDAVKGCTFTKENQVDGYFKYTEVLYWILDRQDASGPPCLGYLDMKYHFDGNGGVTAGDYFGYQKYTDSRGYSKYTEDDSEYISTQEAEYIKAFILNNTKVYGNRNTSVTTPISAGGRAFVEAFDAATIVPNYLRDGGVGYLVKQMYSALGAYPTRLDGEAVTLNKFTSTLYNGVPAITSPDNALVGIQYFTNLEKLSVVGDTENEHGLSVFLDSSALLNFFNQMTTYNTKIKDLEMIACARNYVEFDVEFTERLVALERLNYAANFGIKNVGPLVNLNMGKLAYLNIAGVDVSFEFSEYVMENIYYKYNSVNGEEPTIYYLDDESSTLSRYRGKGTPAESLTYLNEIGKIRSEYLQLCHQIVTESGNDKIIWRIESGNKISYITVAGDIIGFDTVENYYYCKKSVGGLEAGHIYSFNSNGGGYFIDIGEFAPVSSVPNEIEFTDEEKQNATGSGENTITEESVISTTVDNSSTAGQIGSVTNQSSTTSSSWGNGSYGTLYVTYVDQNGNSTTATVSNVSRIGCDRSIKKTVVSEITVTVENFRAISKQAYYYVEADGTLVRCVYTFKSGTAKEQTYEVTRTYWSNDYYYVTGNNNSTKTYLSNTNYRAWTQLSYDYYVRSGWNTSTKNVKVNPYENFESEISGYDENNYRTSVFDDTVTKDSEEILVSPIGVIETEEKVNSLRKLMAAAISGTAVYKYTGNTRNVNYYNNSTALYKSFSFNANYYYDVTVDTNGFVTFTRNTAIANNSSVGSGGMDDILAAANASIGTSKFLSYYGMYYGYAGNTLTAASGNTYEYRGIYRLLIGDDGRFYFEHDAEKMGLKVNTFSIVNAVKTEGGLFYIARDAVASDEGMICYYSGNNDFYHQGKTFYMLTYAETGEFMFRTFGAVDDYVASNGNYNISNERIYVGNYYGGTGGKYQIVVSATVIINGEEYVRRFLVDVIG